ncbi:O-antigen ligase family protein [Bradyrhizobium liaoningense]|uniref:O-antigen ligase family protein n=1 Tax=Bradyrhizobium liaoningense TaxID=43992 RepID=UPI001BAC01B4|nr:O-antigen ligase family protein [Bradyrhizobium liaoningense]MBR0712623.1 O-antigen ligase family protein [Bradyrhizobium liaoningense]
MSASLASSQRHGVWPLPGWLAAVLMLAVVAGLGGTLGGLSRLVFVLGCGAVGWYAWRQGAAAHLQAALVLFTFAPFVRRLVDLAIGFDTLGLMLIGPLLAILVPVLYLPRLLETEDVPARWFWPLGIVACSVIYAGMLSMAQADWNNAASGTLKWLAPLLYAAVLMLSADRRELIDAATAAFLVILPVTGLYAIYQYVDPPAWDQYWMQLAPILSIGQPIPYGVRSFSTMNSPASYASFTAVGLFLLAFSQKRWPALLIALPAGLGLLLSLYRTAWISLAVGILFCLLFSATRRRASMILIGTAVALVLAATLTPFGDVVGERLSTLGEGTQDGSAQERLEEFVTLWKLPDSSLFGSGFTITDVGSAGAMPIDGMIIACWLSMGIIVGGLCLAALCWSIGNAVSTAFADRSADAVIVGALALGALAQLPLANITSGESGFLFWTFAVLSTPRLIEGSVE